MSGLTFDEATSQDAPAKAPQERRLFQFRAIATDIGPRIALIVDPLVDQKGLPISKLAVHDGGKRAPIAMLVDLPSAATAVANLYGGEL